jgi:hypothetical protein
MQNFLTAIAAFFVAALPGVVVALLSQYLQQRRDNVNQRRLYASARRLLALEVNNNRTSLDAFWGQINRLDAEHHEDGTEHLAAMYYGGLVGYELPQWGFYRWERLEADTFAAFAEKELAGIDQMNRAFKSITEYYGSLITLTDSDKAELNKNVSGRFWGNDLARERYPIYSRLAATIQQATGAPSPMDSDS